MAATPCSTREMFEALAEFRYFTGHFKESFFAHTHARSFQTKMSLHPLKLKCHLPYSLYLNKLTKIPKNIILSRRLRCRLDLSSGNVRSYEAHMKIICVIEVVEVHKRSLQIWFIVILSLALSLSYNLPLIVPFFFLFSDGGIGLQWEYLQHKQ